MLQMLARAADERGGTVLQIGQGGAIGVVTSKSSG